MGIGDVAGWDVGSGEVVKIVHHLPTGDGMCTSCNNVPPYLLTVEYAFRYVSHECFTGAMNEDQALLMGLVPGESKSSSPLGTC